MQPLVVELDPYCWTMWDVLEENQDCSTATVLELVFIVQIVVMTMMLECVAMVGVLLVNTLKASCI